MMSDHNTKSQISGKNLCKSNWQSSVHCIDFSNTIKGIEKVRFYTSLCQESSLLSRHSVRRLLCPFSSSPRLKTRKVLSFGYSGLSFGMQGSKLTYVRQSVTDKNHGGHIDFFTYQSDLAHSD
jgi:hypothetical protein